MKEWLTLLAYAAVIGTLLFVVLRYALGCHWAVAAATSAASFLCTVLVNWILTSSLERRRTPGALLPALVSSVVFGSGIAVVAVPYVFESDVVALHFAEIGELQEEVADLAARIENPERPDVDDDPTVAARLQDHQRVKDAYEQADKDRLCELDGTCGSRRYGDETAYKGRDERFQRLKVEVETAERALNEARGLAQQRIGRAVDLQTAPLRPILDDRRAKLDRLVKERSAVENEAVDLGFGNHMQALPGLVGRRPLMASAAFLGIVIGYLLLHLVPLSFPEQAQRSRQREYEQAEAIERRHRRQPPRRGDDRVDAT